MSISEAQEPFHVSFSLAAPTVMAGEPILLAYEITNPSDANRELYLGRDGDDWITAALVDEDGHPAKARTIPAPIRGGAYSAGMRVGPLEQCFDSLVITREFQSLHVGRWELRIGARPYSSFRPSRPLEMAAVPSLSFTLNVTAPNPARLREIAATYRRTAAGRQGVQEESQERQESSERRVRQLHQAITALRALLSMPEEYALAEWQALADIPYFRHSQLLMKELAHAMTPSAADILAQFWDPNPGPLLIQEFPVVLLDMMYRAGDAMLRQHIEEIFAGYGKAIPERALAFIGA